MTKITEFRLTPSQESVLKDLISDYIKPRVQELIKVANSKDEQQYSSSRLKPHNLAVIMLLFNFIIKGVDINIFKKALQNLYPSVYQTSQSDADAPSFIQVLLAIHHLANNTNVPLQGSYAETICDPRFFTTCADRSQQNIIHHSLSIICREVKKEISKQITETQLGVPANLRPSLTIS